MTEQKELFNIIVTFLVCMLQPCLVDRGYSSNGTVTVNRVTGP